MAASFGNRQSRRTLNDGAGPFEVTVLEAEDPCRIVLFAVGGGGDPGRHLPLLASLAECGCTIVAPHFERLVAPAPTESDLLLRARRLGLALDAVLLPGVPVAGVGHSIGATMLLALAGGQASMRGGQKLSIAQDGRLDRLVLLAPATDFFRAPGALDAVRTPILAWAGSDDAITPPGQTLFLRDALVGQAPVEVRVVEGAGHFSFMNELPPQVTDPLADRGRFLAGLAAEMCRFITNG